MGTRELLSPGYGLLIELSLRNRRLEEWAEERTGAREGNTSFLAPTTSKGLLRRLDRAEKLWELFCYSTDFFYFSSKNDLKTCPQRKVPPNSF